MFVQKSLNIPLAGFIFSLIGVLYCLIMAFGVGAEALCLTSGCALISDFKVLGLSPWWWGALSFAGIAALCFFHFRVLAYALSVLMLLGDCLFLLLMFFMAPCTSCLIAALLIFCAWSSLRVNWRSLIRPRVILVGTLGAIWSLLFFLNLGLAVEDMAPRWRMAGPDKAKIAVYFSPSCRACSSAVGIFDGQAAFYPVVERDEDLPLLADLKTRLEGGQSLGSALADVNILKESGQYQAPALGFAETWAMRLFCLRNQARLTRLGYGSVPVVMFEGLPASWITDSPNIVPSTREGERQGLPLNFGQTVQCGKESAEPCPE